MVLKDIFTVGSADMTHAFLKLFFQRFSKLFSKILKQVSDNNLNRNVLLKYKISTTYNI